MSDTRNDRSAASTPEFISERLPVPKADFHESEHQALHNGMGEEFDKPHAAGFVREAYKTLRSRQPDIHPSHALATVRDAWHAVRLGLMHPAAVAHSIEPVARRRHRMTGP
jgi:hypothetical protein